MRSGRRSDIQTIYTAGLVAMAAWIGMCAIGVLTTSYMVIKEIIDLNHTSYGVVLTLLIATFISTTIINNMIHKNPLISSAISGAGAMLLLLLLNLLFTDNGMENFWVTALVVFGGAMAAFLVQLKPKKRTTYKFKKI